MTVAVTAADATVLTLDNFAFELSETGGGGAAAAAVVTAALTCWTTFLILKKRGAFGGLGAARWVLFLACFGDEGFIESEIRQFVVVVVAAVVLMLLLLLPLLTVIELTATVEFR